MLDHMFSFVRKSQVVLQSGWTIQQPHQQWVRAHVSPCLYQCLVLSAFCPSQTYCMHNTHFSPTISSHKIWRQGELMQIYRYSSCFVPQGTESFVFDSVVSWCMPDYMKLCQANFLGFKGVKSQTLYSSFVTSTKKNLYKNVYCSLIHNNRHLEMNKTSNNRSMNKQFLVFHTGVGSLCLLQQFFLTQELNWGLLRCRWILYQLSDQGSPIQWNIT